MSAADTGRCVVCGQAYSGGARPRWAFHRDGRLVGTIHAPCAKPARWQLYAVSPVSRPLDSAWFESWSGLVLPQPAYESDALGVSRPQMTRIDKPFFPE